MGRLKKVIPGTEISPSTASSAVPPEAIPQTETEKTILELLDMSISELTLLVKKNPSLYGMLLGYAAEMKLEKTWFEGKPEISGIMKHDDHDRKNKGDRLVTYKGIPIKIECKSLQTSMIEGLGNGRFKGKVQCDASDRRMVRLPDGSEINTTCLLVGEFDILAANIFAFEKKWRFVFALNQDLPRTCFRKYTPAQQKCLLASLIPVSWPPEPPFYKKPFALMDQIVKKRKAGART